MKTNVSKTLLFNKRSPDLKFLSPFFDEELVWISSYDSYAHVMNVILMLLRHDQDVAIQLKVDQSAYLLINNLYAFEEIDSKLLFRSLIP